MRCVTSQLPADSELDPTDPSGVAPRIGTVPLSAGRDSPFGPQAKGRIRKFKRKDNDGYCPP